MTVLADDSSGFEELRRLLAQRAVDVVLVWHAESLSPLQDELSAAGCGLYAVHQQVEPDAAERPLLAEVVEEMPQVSRSISCAETTTSKRIACARARGKHWGRPRISGEIEEAIRAKLAAGKGICKIARELRCGHSTVARVRDAGCVPVGG
jgi:DNA invertase Pin-like site-specific DNA recombinase